jgi:hypothetical protein
MGQKNQANLPSKRNNTSNEAESFHCFETQQTFMSHSNAFRSDLSVSFASYYSNPTLGLLLHVALALLLSLSFFPSYVHIGGKRGTRNCTCEHTWQITQRKRHAFLFGQAQHFYIVFLFWGHIVCSLPGSYPDKEGDAQAKENPKQ